MIAAPDLEQHRLPARRSFHPTERLLRVADRRAVHFEDHVARLQAALCRAARLDAHDGHPLRGIGHADPERVRRDGTPGQRKLNFFILYRKVSRVMCSNRAACV